MTQSGKVINLRKRGLMRRVLPRMVRDSENPKRPAPLRTRRRKARALIALATLLLLAACVWGVGWASYLPQFTMQSIQVVGAKKVPADLIQRYVDSFLYDGSRPFISRRSIFVYPRADLEKAVQDNFPHISSAKVSRVAFLATAATMSIEERESYARWCSARPADSEVVATRCYTMDDSGFIFEERGVGGAPDYIFYGGISASEDPIGQRFVPGHFPGITALLKLLGQAGLDAEAITIDGKQDMLITLAKGFTLKISFGQDATALIRSLQLILSSEPLKGREGELEYIDLRFDNRVYYRLKGEAETTN